jgi:hypothetical protein
MATYNLTNKAFPVSGSCLEDQFEVNNDPEDKLSVVGQHCGRIV